MAATNFSRDVLEENQTITRDLIDFETVIENPCVEEKQDFKSISIYAKKYRKKNKKFMTTATG